MVVIFIDAPDLHQRIFEINQWTVGPYDFVQILPACGLNTYQIMYAETLDFQCQHLELEV